MQKKWEAIPYDQSIANDLQKKLGIHPLFCQLLVQRGITTFEAAKQFFRPTLSDLHDPFLMLNMSEAVERILLAIKRREAILLYGDYDADGVSSIALLHDFLSELNLPIEFYAPDRYKEGYGVSFKGVDYAKSKGIRLMITLDCGITAQSAVRAANAYGIDCIICDHHLPEAELPDALAILNPKQENCLYPFKELSGCGVAFKLAQGINQALHRSFDYCEKLLDVLAISIAADIVKVTGENRILLHFGLQQLSATKRLGLQLLIQQKNLEPPLRVRDLVFGIAPLLNAAGRLADAHQAVNLLLAKNAGEANKAYRTLHLRNEMRKEYEQRILAEAKEMLAENENWRDRSVIVLHQKHWHKGVLGIVASKLVEQFHRPTFLLAESDGKLMGSARSFNGIDIHVALESCSDLLINFGGHRYAAGLQLQPNDLYFLEDRLEAYISTHASETALIPSLDYSGELDFQTITPAFWNLLQNFAPFGPGNRNPLFISRNVKADPTSRILKGRHLKLWLKQENAKAIGGVAFGLADRYPLIEAGEAIDVCYNLQMNTWKGKSNLQLVVKDLRRSVEN